MRIHVITTGGTIDKVYFDARSEYEVGEPQVAEVLRDAGVTLAATTESVLRKDSLEMTDADRRLIRERAAAAPCDRVLITHGTDTLIDTAKSLAGIPGKTIVLTGSMQPALFRVTDAVFNIGFAIGALQCLPPGVHIAMNGCIFDPHRVRKNASMRCFEAI
jgi:L-asparaginase